MGGFLTGFLGAGGQEALGEKHHHQEQQDIYRNAQLQSLLRMRDIAAQNGASPDILDQFNKSIGELQPGYHAPKNQAPAQAQQTQTAVPSLTLPGMTNIPMVGESPTRDITGNTPIMADAPGAHNWTGEPSEHPVSAAPTPTATAPKPGVFMQNGAMPKAPAPDTTPIVPPSISTPAAPVTIPGQQGPTVTNSPMTLSRAIAEANDPRTIALKQAYIKQIESQAAYQQQISQFQQTMDNLAPILKKAGLPDDQIEQIKRDAAIQQFSPRAFMMGRIPPRIAGQALSPQDAIMEQERTGEPFMDINGQPIELGVLPPDVKLNPVVYPGGRVAWQVFSQKQRPVTFDNTVTAQGEFGLNPNAPALGNKQVATTTNRQVPSAGGGVLNLSSTRTPQTPNRTAPTPSNPNGAPVLKTRNNQPVTDYQGAPLSTDDVVTPPKTESGAPGPTGTASGNKPRKVGQFVKQANDAQLAKQVQVQGIEPDMNKLYPQQGTAARKALPAFVAVRGIFGDPERPELPTIADFSDLAGNPHTQKVMGEAFKLMESEPINLENPQALTDGLASTVAADNGFKNWQAQVMAKVQRQALADATPRELSYFNATMNAMADIIGARFATGANAAQWSVRAIQNELPLIGLQGANSQKDYLQKLMGINSMLANVVNTTPDHDRARWWLKKREADIRDLQSRASSSPPQNQGAGPQNGDTKSYQGHDYKFDGKQWVLQEGK